MADIITIIIIAVLMALAIWVIVRNHRSGKSCLGCAEGSCSSCGNISKKDIKAMRAAIEENRKKRD